MRGRACVHAFGSTAFLPKKLWLVTQVLLSSVLRLSPQFRVMSDCRVCRDAGKMRRWDVVESMPSVGVILYHTDLDAFLMVRQFRPPVYATRLREATAAGKEAPPMTAGEVHPIPNLVNQVCSLLLAWGLQG